MYIPLHSNVGLLCCVIVVDDVCCSIISTECSVGLMYGLQVFNISDINCI